MAKKVNPDIPLTAEPAGENAGTMVEATTQPVIKTEKETVEVADPQIMQVLRVYPEYPELYVDRHGGAFTSDTPAIVRKDAILYKNPFYQPSKTKR